MRVLVCGGRDYADRDAVFLALDRLLRRDKNPVACIIHGAAHGADSLAGQWAWNRGVDVEPYPADWKAHGRAAGPIRNARMLAEGRPDAVVAFPSKGPGTRDMVGRAEAAGLKVWRPYGP